MKVTVNGITVVNKNDIGDDKIFFEYLPTYIPAFTLERVMNAEGDIDFKYIWADFPEDIQYISFNLFGEGTSLEVTSLEEIVEWIMAVYPNWKMFI